MKITQNWREEIKTIPNGLSLFRIVLLPVYLYFVWQRSFYLAGLVIAVSGLTDFWMVISRAVSTKLLN